ncbi:RNA polymerase subunit sigma-24 [Aldersonia sp. NBC_00410]|uniref:sigma factor-like helix-turn-helix DNA-binding protein n=1 Tax=Aldersonia sp. NBC_00410 TaxID=2975954 RepID=UPI0022546FCB|nr:sigma factor-like helix-turn-helix DNA-binding protein [Aldersonia sp. NBC_00410]MCX5044412.1 RNA polymerase subunit sigma-24 [Aldersonia sp. NBC_00410]
MTPRIEDCAMVDCSPPTERFVPLLMADSLTAIERVVLVLHDMFDMPFDDIAPIIGRTPDAARQITGRARRRLPAPAPVTDAGDKASVSRSHRECGRCTSRREVVAAVLAAAHQDRFDDLVALLDRDVVLRADVATARAGSGAIVRGATAVAGRFAERARTACFALVDGRPEAIWLGEDGPCLLAEFTVAAGKVVAIDLTSDPRRLTAVDLAMLSS